MTVHRPLDPQAQLRARQNKVLLAFAISSIVILVFCLIPLVTISFMYGPKVTKEPVAVLDVSKKIGALAIPPDFVGQIAQSADNSQLNVQIARFDHSEGRGRLVVGLVQFKEDPRLLSMLGFSEASFLKGTIDNLFPGLRALDVRQTRELALTVHGQKVIFEIQAGEDMRSTTKLKQVSTTFTGTRGTIQILLQAESDFLTDEAIDAFLKSVADESHQP